MPKTGRYRRQHRPQRRSYRADRAAACAARGPRGRLGRARLALGLCHRSEPARCPVRLDAGHALPVSHRAMLRPVSLATSVRLRQPARAQRRQQVARKDDTLPAMLGQSIVRPGDDRVPKPKSPSPLPPPINCWSSQVAPIMRACRAMGRWDFSSTSTPPPRSCASYGRLPPSALPFEGITGSRDSGGPLLIGDGSLRRLVGLAPWSQYPPGRPFVEGLYGEIVYAVRVFQYVGWIEKVISAP